MRRISQIALLLIAGAALCNAQQVVDRIVATVNRQPVLLSDWEVEMRYEAMIEQKPLPLSDDIARGALDRLIDQELLRQQIRSYQLEDPATKEIGDRVADIRKQLPNGGNDAAFQAILARYGLTESELRNRISVQLTILRFIDVRLRPSVHVDRRSIENYYNDTLLPQLRTKGEKPAPLAEVAPQIEELLSQQRVDALTNDWLKDLRQQSEIRIDPAAATPTAGTSAKQQGTK
jgi:hypothetical protein